MKRYLLVGCISLMVMLASACAVSASAFDRVLELVPANVTEFMLLATDWLQIKTQLGLDSFGSQVPAAFKMELARRLSQDQAAASAYALSYLDLHASMWGWDLADLDWEANISCRELMPTYVLKLREDFDFAPVSERFVERGFVQTQSFGAVVYSHKLDPSADWIRTTELSILNTAYVAEEKLMILSGSRSSIDALLATRAGKIPSLAADAFATSVMHHLGCSCSAVVLLGLGECIRFTPNPLLDLMGTIPTQEQIEEMKAKIEEQELLVPYRALGVGYRSEETDAIGTIVFEYDTPELAAIDLPVRRLLAEEGMSKYYDGPISESYFTILAGRAKDSAAILTVTPVNNQPSRLLRMILYRDAVFAGCSS